MGEKIGIMKIKSVLRHARTTEVVIDTVYNGVTQEDYHCAFFNSCWEEIQKQMQFYEEEALDVEESDEFESMSEKCWRKLRFMHIDAYKLSDKEIAELIIYTLKDYLYS